jgi:hypothetical protein
MALFDVFRKLRWVFTAVAVIMAAAVAHDFNGHQAWFSHIVSLIGNILFASLGWSREYQSRRLSK